jgi:hypothetical protein
MNWVRSNIRLGSRLALIALALQLALSFGHFHPIAAPTAGAQVLSANGPAQPASDHDRDSALDLCAICAVMAMAQALTIVAPPALPLPQDFAFRYLASETGSLELTAPRSAFQPRAPPAS